MTRTDPSGGNGPERRNPAGGARPADIVSTLFTDGAKAGAMAGREHRARQVAGLAALAFLVALAGCSYQPPVVCGLCDADDYARGQGYDVTTARETLVIDVRQDGSARWTARMTLAGPDVATLRENETLVRSLARSTFEYAWTSASPASPRNLTVGFEGDTLVVGVDDPALAHRSVGGVLVVDRFNDERSGTWGGYEIEADAVVLRAPEGSVVANRPPNGAVRPASVTWRRYVDKRTYVVFAPERTFAPDVAAEAAVLASVASWTLGPTLLGALPSVMLLGGIGVVLLYRPRPDGTLREDLRGGRRVAIAIVAGLFLATVALAWSRGEDSVSLLVWAVVANPVLVLGWLGLVSDGSHRYRTGGLAVLVVLPVAVSFAVVLEAGTEAVDATGWLVAVVAVAVVLGGLGRVAYRGAPVRAAGLAALASLPLAVVLGFGLGVGAAAVYTFAWAVVFGTTGAVVFLGARRYEAAIPEPR